jgi:hypothetical protein
LDKECHFFDLLCIFFIRTDFVSQFIKRRHLSYQLPSKAKSKESSEIKFREGVSFINKIRSYNFPPHKIAALDKTSFTSETKNVKHISIKGGYDFISSNNKFTIIFYVPKFDYSFFNFFRGRPRREGGSKGSITIIMYSMVVADGTVGQVYLETDTKIPTNIQLPPETRIEYIPKTKKASDRRGERGYIACLEQNTADKSLVKGDIVLTDAEKSFHTEAVNDYLADKGIYADQFPAGLGHLMNPCDSYYHSSIKARYWRYIDELEGEVSLENMIACIHKAVAREREESIRNYFKGCGIVGNKPAEEIMNHLIYQGLSPAKKFKDLHLKQLKSFIEWKWANHYNTMIALCNKYEKMYENLNL